MALTLNTKERIKWIAGAGLLAVAVLLLYRLFFATGERPVARPAAERGGAFSALETPASPRPRLPATARGRRVEPAPPPGAVDPTLRLDLLAKAQQVTYKGNERNIFLYHTPPPPPPPKPVSSGVTAAKKNGGPASSSAPPPPIPLKYYGYAHKPTETAKKAFFAEGEEIYIAMEGEIVNRRYKILKIGVNTVEVEDLVTKHKQTLSLQES